MLHCIVCLKLYCSGETAFKHMLYDFGWPRYPMIHRVKDIAAFLPMTVICGARSSVDYGICQRIQELRRDSFVDTHVCSEIYFVQNLCQLCKVQFCNVTH